MKSYNVAFAVVLGITSMASVGCDAKKHLEDVGFKQGDSIVEKGTIKYDTLVDKDETCNQAWADYEGNLTRRAQMIPQIIGIVKGASSHEQATLVAIAQAQANATRPEVRLDPQSANDMSDPDKFAAYQRAQSTLGTQLSRLMVQAPAMYPNLATMPLFTNLQVQVEGTENRLQRNREVYNAAVKDYNGELRHVSGHLINPITGHEFKPRVYFTADAADKAAPTVDFGNGPATTAIVPAAPAPGTH
jgi:LemA protein